VQTSERSVAANPGHVFHLVPVPLPHGPILGLLRVNSKGMYATLDVYNIKIKLEGVGNTRIAQCHPQECYERGMSGA